MNKPKLLASVAIATVIGLLSIGCASTQPAGEQINDSAIAAKIKTKFVADPEVNPFRIDVDVNEGVVRLSGTVEEAENAREAVRLARNTDGVVKVIDDIVVGEPKIGDRLDNTKVASSVKAKIVADPELNPFNINVDAENGVVTLMGRVASDRAKAHAGELAKRTDGVVRVKNLLEVGDEADR